ncbi:MAG: DoxX family membrane protein, partial [Planctomycetes bacterium]|nr:DoxX family membrane protein [Planctomycetota bacterium]
MSTSKLSWTEDAARLVMRISLALVFTFHGAQKLFGWFGGYGIEGTAGFYES